MTDRSPYDGRPYYCNACGLGLSEYLACEDGGCDLETQAEAEKRRSSICEDCPPRDYPTDVTRCAPCPRRTPSVLLQHRGGEK